MTLPTLQASVDRIFPFAPKDGIKKGFIKNINLQYNLRAENQYQTNDTLFFKKEMFEQARTGMQHTIPLSTNFKVFKHFSVSTSINFQETWYLKTIRKEFEVTSIPPLLPSGKIITTDVHGFDAFRTYSFSNSIGTVIYGTFNFKESAKIQSIRHTITPSISHSYLPSFEKYYDTYAKDASGTMDTYTRFENGAFGAPSNTFANNIGFSINNKFEAKVRDKDSTATELKKIILLNNLTLTGSYDMAADSLRWSPMRISGGTLLFKQKMNVNFAATLDPYALGDKNQRINTFNIDNGGSLFRMTSANMTINYALTSSENEKKKNVQGARNGGRDDDLFGDNAEINSPEIDNNEQEDTFKGFYNAQIPWDINLAYSVTYSNLTGEKKISSHSLMVSANTDLTPMWRIGVSSGYDFTNKGVTFTQIRLNRDLMSWNMNFNWSPFGQNSFWGFFIGIKAGILSDIKWDKQQQRDQTLR